jgi:cAMP phosphodiesterase
VKLRVLGCYGGNTPGLGMTAFLVDDALALDAGWVSEALTLDEQVRVKDVLISHSHLDHTCSLPFLIDNNFSAPGFSLRIHAIPEVIAAMKDHLFNNATWPDFTCLPNDMTPVLKLISIEEETPFEIGGLEVTAVRVSHIVPTTGFVVQDRAGGVAFSSDTGPTERFWQVVDGLDRLSAVITETSFPNELQHIADISGHLTPATLAQELEKLHRDVPVYLYGAKPKHLSAIRNQLAEIGDSRLRPLVQGETYEF